MAEFSSMRIEENTSEPLANESLVINTTLMTTTKPVIEMYIEDKIRAFLWDIIPPILLLLGTVGNILAISIFTRKAFRSSISIYLTALAVSDTFVLYSGLLRYWLLVLVKYDIRTYHRVTCKLLTWAIYTSLDISAWIIVCVTIVRLVSVYVPHKVKYFCTRKVYFTLLCVICLVCSLVNGHFLIGMDIRKYKDGSISCETNDVKYYKFLEKVWPWIDLCFYSLFPSFCIIIGNVLLIRKAFFHLKSNSSITGRRQISIRTKRMSSMTTMLIAISILFVICTTPVSIHIILSVHLPEPNPKDSAVQRLFWCVENLFMYTGNTINFILYCLSGSRFRQEVQLLFRQLMCKKLKGRQCEDDKDKNFCNNRGALRFSQASPISSPGFSEEVVCVSFVTLSENS